MKGRGVFGGVMKGRGRMSLMKTREVVLKGRGWGGGEWYCILNNVSLFGHERSCSYGDEGKIRSLAAPLPWFSSPHLRVSQEVPVTSIQIVKYSVTF